MGNITVTADVGGDQFILDNTGSDNYERDVAAPLSSDDVEIYARDEAGNITTDKSQYLRVIGEWSQPKVDWSGAWDGETYVGDYFSYIDYNRIKNNTLFIIGYASQMYQVTSVDLGAEKDEADLVYADEINAIEQALFTLDEETYGFEYKQKTWYENRNVPTADDYNRIERMQLKLYENLVAQRKAQRRLAFTLGGQKGIKV